MLIIPMHIPGSYDKTWENEQIMQWMEIPTLKQGTQN